MDLKRRFFLFAAPAIVAAPSLMRVSAAMMPKPLRLLTWDEWGPPDLALTPQWWVTNTSAQMAYINGMAIMPCSDMIIQCSTPHFISGPGADGLRLIKTLGA